MDEWLPLYHYTCTGASCHTKVVNRVGVQPHYIIGGCCRVTPPTTPPHLHPTHLHRISDDVAICCTRLCPIQDYISHPNTGSKILHLLRNGVERFYRQLTRRYRADTVIYRHGEGVSVGWHATSDSERGGRSEQLGISDDTSLKLDM